MPPSKTQKWIFFFQVILSNKSFSVLSMISLIFTSQYYSYFSFELITYHIVEFWEHFQKSWYLFRHPKPWIVSENSSLSTKLPIYEKSTRSMKCPVYGKYYLGNVLSMNFFFLSNALSMKCLVFEMFYMQCPSMECPIYDFVIYEMTINEMSVYEISIYEMTIYEMSVYEMSIYLMSYLWFFSYPWNVHLWNFLSFILLSIKWPIYDFVIYEMSIYEMSIYDFLSMKCPSIF